MYTNHTLKVYKVNISILETLLSYLMLILTVLELKIVNLVSF